VDVNEQKNPNERKYRIANWYLLAAIISINLYIASAPLIPQFQFWLEKRGDKQTQLSELVTPTSLTPTPTADPHADTNHLVVPSMLLNEPVYEGRSESVLNKGIWHRPNTSTPDKGGNTVLVAHRYTYTNPRGTFYYLDKLAVGDSIALFWGDKKYIYKVASTKTVKATQTEVEANTEQPQLTLYTCTPLWLPKDRLVVTANLEAII
jgi:sortase A